MHKTILCVDDESIVVTSLKTQLHTFFGDEYDIEIAQNGDEALEILEELMEDDVEVGLIISDFLMPGMNGDKFLIKAHSLLPKAKKVLLTGQADLEGIANIINDATLYRYIAKPWEQSDLIITVKEALKSYNQESELAYYTKHLEELVEQKSAENRTYLEIVDNYLIASKTDINGVITEVSKAMCKITQYTKDELIGKNHNIVRHPDVPKSLYKEMWTSITNGKTWEGEIKNRKKDGRDYWVYCRVSPTFGVDNNIVGYAAIREDISDKKKVEELSVTDYMTGLYNRRFFNEIFQKEISRAHRESKELGFAMFDVDHFKQYNDTYGHQMGDDALISISSCVKKDLHRGGDYAFRLGGEEFGILVYDTDLETFSTLIKNIKDDLENLHIIHEKNTASKYVTASFGAVTFNCSDQTDVDKIFKYTDDLLYEVKQSGRNNLIVKEYKN